ncbi:MAG: hypothetical protein QW087_07880, partial [Methanomassiliicoccales archaeon]
IENLSVSTRRVELHQSLRKSREFWQHTYCRDLGPSSNLGLELILDRLDIPWSNPGGSLISSNFKIILVFTFSSYGIIVRK